MGPLTRWPLLAVLLVAVSAGSDGSAPPEVAVRAGTLRGKWTRTRYGRSIAAFEGVPYAKPPVGPLRLEPPQPAESWTGVRAADAPGDVCTQRNVFFLSDAIEGSEDCLYLNVYAPETIKRADPLPVLVFVHGGGFIAGTGIIYGPEYILDRDVLLVNFNYRLGPLGFLSTGDDVLPGNNGLKDMVLALRWVKDNIRQFGGDPDLVTIFGESAGGASVHLLTLSPLAKGLFHRVIAMSGNAVAPWAVAKPDVARRQSQRVAEAVGCPTEPSEELKKCLQGKTGAELVATDKTFMRWMYHPLVPLKPTVEPAGPGAFLDALPVDVYAAGRTTDVPFMTGFTAQEGCLVVVAIAEQPELLQEYDERFEELSAIISNLDPEDEDVRGLFARLRKLYLGDERITKANLDKLMDLFTDSFFVPSAIEGIKLHKKHNKSPAFFYEMDRSSKRTMASVFGAKKADYGMCHGDDLLYLFPLTVITTVGMTPEEEVYSNKMLDLFVNFAVKGRPTEDGSWKAVENADKAEYLYFTTGSELTMRSDFAPDRMRVWTNMATRRDEL